MSIQRYSSFSHHKNYTRVVPPPTTEIPSSHPHDISISYDLASFDDTLPHVASNLDERDGWRLEDDHDKEDELMNIRNSAMNNETCLTTEVFLSRFRLVMVEPVIFLSALATTLTFSVQTSLYLEHTCRVTLGYNATTCASLEDESNQQLEELVEPAANVYLVWVSIVEAFVPAVLTLFVGPWSDIYGRKPFILLPIVGYMLKYVLSLVLSLYHVLPPVYFLLASIPVSLGGGHVSVSLCYCYTIDITSQQRRAFRIGILHACHFAGMLLGTATSTYLFNAGGYVATYLTAAILCCLALLLGFFLVESVPDVTECNLKSLSSLVDVVLVKDMIATCWKKREKGKRAIIFLVITTLATIAFFSQGEKTVIFMFTRYKFGWTISDFSEYGSISMLLYILGTLIGVSLLSTYLGIADEPIVIISLLLKMAAMLLNALSPQSWFMYLAAGVGMFGGVVSPLCRAIISKAVEPKDVGKVFSLLAVVEAITPLASAPVYTYIYNTTLLTLPGAFFLLTCSFVILGAVLMTCVAIIQKLHPAQHYDRLTED